MEQTYALLTALCLASGLQAQTTALDFTANDCNGISHSLFSELEAGNAVIIELVMMGCQPCVTASESITANVIPNVSDASRVKFYSIGFTNNITCTQMNDWKNTNAFTHTVLAGMSAQTTHYGGMGMPTIAVVGGGSTHGVYYSEQGHASSQNPTILAAVEAALAASVGVPEVSAPRVVVSPNPTTDVLTISGGNWTNARVLDLQGREVLNARTVNSKLDVTDLVAGAYVLYLTDAKGISGTTRFEKK